MKRKISILLLSCFILSISLNNSFSKQNDILNSDADLYIEKANELKLYNTPQWLALLHYKNSKSLISTKKFFLSKNGRKNAKLEMEETIKSFYKINIEDSKNYQHTICRFPARFEFLNKKLDFKNLPKVKCKKFEEFYNEVNPESLTLIFPSAYINNPASMFGHTLIRIDRKDSYKNNSHINSIIINYGADTGGETSGIIFAFRGVFGLYKGFFSATPYYRMTNTYSNLENRDIWEYKLNYTQEEAEFYTKHMWELLFADINYYFFKKNCSYLMLETLNVMRPEVDLTQEYDVYTAPVDTIKTLQRYKIINSQYYRMSLQKKIQVESKNLNKNEIKSIIKYVKKDEPLDLNNNQLYYGVAYQYLEYQKAKNNLDLKTYRKKSIELLKNIHNSNIELNEEYIKIKEPPPPEKGHKIGRIGLSFGKYNAENYLQLSYKPAYHELIDDENGFEKNSEISFFDGEFRYYFDRERLDLQKFDFVRIKSLAIQDNFFKPISFSILFGVNNLYDDYKVLLLDINGGLTFGNNIFSTFFLIGPKINYSGLFYSDVTIGFNGVAGALLKTKYFKFIFDYKLNRLIQSKYNYDQLSFESNLILNKNLLINFKYQKYFYNSFKNRDDINIGLKILF